jgi:hypothetical protein
MSEESVINYHHKSVSVVKIGANCELREPEPQDSKSAPVSVHQHQLHGAVDKVGGVFCPSLLPSLIRVAG